MFSDDSIHWKKWYYIQVLCNLLLFSLHNNTTTSHSGVNHFSPFPLAPCEREKGIGVWRQAGFEQTPFLVSTPERIAMLVTHHDDACRQLAINIYFEWAGSDSGQSNSLWPLNATQRMQSNFLPIVVEGHRRLGGSWSHDDFKLLSQLY